MSDPYSRGPFSRGHDTPEAQHAALLAADALINRLEELVADELSKKDGLDEKQAFYRIVEMLETSAEITVVRMALGQDPARFGEPTPYAAGDSTG
jgi:hypothetical protein